MFSKRQNMALEPKILSWMLIKIEYQEKQLKDRESRERLCVLREKEKKIITKR